MEVAAGEPKVWALGLGEEARWWREKNRERTGTLCKEWQAGNFDEKIDLTVGGSKERRAVRIEQSHSCFLVVASHDSQRL